MAYIGNTQLNQNYVPAIDYFSGNGSTTAFTLSRPVASVAQVQAVIENVPQNPGDAYTVSGNTITFTSAPPSGTNNIYVYYTSPNTQVVQPGQGTVSPSSLSTGGPYWDTSGNVGIGTTNPTSPLVLYKNSATSVSINIGNSVNSWLSGIDSSGNFANYTNGAYNYIVSTNGSERMRIDSSGLVGIGTNAPNFLVDARTPTLDAFINLQSTGTFQSSVLNLVGRQSSTDNIWSIISTGSGLAGPQLRFTRGGWTGTPSMLIDANANLQFNSGFGSVATAYGCRAWVNFNGTGTVAIRASGNVSSITDNGTGDYTVNFASAMPDANFVGNVSASGPVASQHNVTFLGSPGSNDTSSHPNSSSFRFSTYLVSNSATRADGAMYNVSIVR